MAPKIDINARVTEGDSLIQYALTSDDYLDQFVPIIKAELANKNSLEDLIVKLDSAYKEREQTLEGVSFESIDKLTSSIESISDVAQSSGAISQEVSMVNSQLRKTGLEYLDKKMSALNYKRLHNKISETILTINLCLDMLDKTNKVFELYHHKNYYKALINLDLLMKSRSEDIEMFEFTQKIHKSLPAIKELIIDETFNQLVRWFNVSFEKNLTLIGEQLFEHFEVLNHAWNEQQAEDPNLLSFKVNTPLEKAFRNDELKSFNPLSNDKVHVDLGPVYHSVMVFELIDEFEKLKDDFSNELLRKRDRLIYPIREALATQKLDMFSNNESLKIVIYSLAALLVADRFIGAKQEYKLRSKKQTDDLYSSIMSKFVPILKAHINKYVGDFQHLKELNDILGVFVQILENYDFNVDSLYQVLVTLLQQYINTLTKEFELNYESLSEEENPQPITIENQTQLDNVQLNCFHKFKEAPKEFPVVLPFSIIYAATCLKLRSFIHDIYEFLGKYYIHKNSEILKLIGESIDSVLIKVVLKDLKTKINSSYKEEVSQNLINMEFFSRSVKEIENYLNYSTDPIIARFRSSSLLIRLQSQKEFQNTQTKAEEGMFDMVDSKIDMLFDMIDFDWESKEINEEPSIGIKDMGLFLENIFMLDFSHLPYSIKSLLLIRTFDKIVNFFKQAVYQTDFITNESISNFELDIKYIESIIPDLKLQNGNANQLSADPDNASSTFQTIFVGLKQIIDLLKDGNLETYKDETTRMRKFDTILPEQAIDLIQKLEDFQMLKREMDESSQYGQASDSEDANGEPSRNMFGFKRTKTSTSLSSPSKMSVFKRQVS
ncbi:hypothetical protein OGAPHI_002577 [Ogataea philodendri]|uniref:Exocyst complex component SEC15 n=1 Tax=Ogataea philodendri TaxID=1378263 RepID=A0A9P8PB96_9ASCO|nr:uncharacterized protein OGAPHI_002577 [Ogataea philodendri]KAH3668822.1 hypothetical protein OGAPHI_002577 [Ogataea philodendri]